MANKGPNCDDRLAHAQYRHVKSSQIRSAAVFLCSRLRENEMYKPNTTVTFTLAGIMYKT